MKQKIMFSINVLMLLVLASVIVSARSVPALVNMTLQVDVTSAIDTSVTPPVTRLYRTAYLYPPDGSFPTEFSVTDICELAHDKVTPIQFMLQMAVPENASTWDIGENITMLLNMTNYVYNYTVSQVKFLSSLKDINVDLSKDLSYCRNTTANTVSTGEYQLCTQQKSQYLEEKNTCQSSLKQADSGKITNIIIGAVGAAIIMLATKKRYYQAPTEKEWK